MENDDTGDAEERRVAWFLAGGCKCKLNDGNPCYLLFTPSQISSAHDDCRQLTRDQLDIVVMGQLRALCQRDSVTQKSKAINTGRKRPHTDMEGIASAKQLSSFSTTCQSLVLTPSNAVGWRRGYFHGFERRFSHTIQQSCLT